jgi:hypothetical protein
MKRGTPDHPKTRALARILGLPSYAATGLLEHLWQWTACYAPDGGVGHWADTEIADGVGWEGDASQLVQALLQARLVDRSETCRLVVHDWQEHAEDSVHRALARATRLFADGSRPKLTRLGSERAEIEARYAAAAQRQDGAATAPTGDVRPTCAQVSPSAPEVRTECAPAVAVAVASNVTPPVPPATAGGDVRTTSPNGTSRQAQQQRLVQYALSLGVESAGPRIRQRLRRGDSEQAVRAWLSDVAASDARERQEREEVERVHVAAGAWIEGRGGPDAVVAEVLAWCADFDGPLDPHDAAYAWASAVEAPVGVAQLLAMPLHRARAARRAAGAGPGPREIPAERGAA